MERIENIGAAIRARPGVVDVVWGERKKYSFNRDKIKEKVRGRSSESYEKRIIIETNR
jgi:hypothetical protein